MGIDCNTVICWGFIVPSASINSFSWLDKIIYPLCAPALSIRIFIKLDMSLSSIISPEIALVAFITVAISKLEPELVVVTDAVVLVAFIPGWIGANNCGYRVSKSVTLVVAPH